MSPRDFGGGGGASGMQGQLQIAPLTKVVKILLIVTVGVWFFGNIVIEHFMTDPKITLWLGLTPYSVIKDFYLWQPVTYLFMHDANPLHIVFNMLLLWWLGGELEQLWGSKFFAIYYFVCGIGAAFLYCFAALILSIWTSKVTFLVTPVIGASAAIFGLMVAYGIFFGERPVYFMFFFRMKARYFVLILVGIEIVMTLNNSSGSGSVANLAHLGGIIMGYLFLKLWPYIGGGKGRGDSGGTKKKRSKNLRLVVNNTDFNAEIKPKYWQ